MSPAEPGDRPQLLDAIAVARGAEYDGVAWSVSIDQLHLNVVRFGPGAGVAEHVNDEVDVAGVVIAGEMALRLGLVDELSLRVRRQAIGARLSLGA